MARPTLSNMKSGSRGRLATFADLSGRPELAMTLSRPVGHCLPIPSVRLRKQLIRKCAQRDRPPALVRLICGLETYDRGLTRVRTQGGENMLGIIAAVLIILWLLGFFAFHVTTAFIHIVLVVGLILLVLHFVRGSSGSA